MSRHLLDKGIIPYVYIEDYNTQSVQLFEKAGYEYAERGNWVHFGPN